MSAKVQSRPKLVYTEFLNYKLYQGADPGEGDVGDATPIPPAIFNNVFDKCNFFIISNLFDTNDLYALSTRKWKKREQNVSYLVKNSELGTKHLNKICLKNC